MITAKAREVYEHTQKLLGKMHYFCVFMTYTDGNNDYEDVSITSLMTDDVEIATEMIREYCKDIFAVGTEQDEDDKNTFWEKYRERLVQIERVQLIPEEDYKVLEKYITPIHIMRETQRRYLKHMLNPNP